MSKESTSVSSEKKELRQEAVKQFFAEFFHSYWEQLPRLRELSGLSEEEVQSLPSNKIFMRIVTSLMRVYQDKYRSYMLLKSKAPVSRKEATQIIDSFLGNDQVPIQNKSEVIYSATEKIVDSEGKVRYDGGRYFPKRFLDEMVNPFNNKETVFATEYAQLVNLLSRKLQKEGVLSSFEVAKLTIFASLQQPPGRRIIGIQYPEVIESQAFLTGSRIDGELQLMDDKEFRYRVPITEVRLRDRGFVRKIKFLEIIRDRSFKEAIIALKKIF